MQPVENLFKASAANLSGTMSSHAGKAGFKVPNYQRTYDWSEENVKRLLEDCLNGFHYLSLQQSEESYTFLGTIILVSEPSQEPTFDGTSLIVVDGQQRLTTLSLLCCALTEHLIRHSKDTGGLSGNVKNWIDEEVKFHLDTLFECVIGTLTERGRSYPYPRLVRDVDYRARLPRDTEYRSVIARFLKDFSDYYQNNHEVFKARRSLGDANESRLFKNYEYIKDQVELALYHGDTSSCELDHEPVQHGHYQRRGMRGLFEKLALIQGEDEQNRAVSDVASRPEIAGLIRLLLFSSYLTKCVVLTRVETESEKYAFDIFDALNTTGEPLTALETLRPKIISFEDDIDGFNGSDSQSHMENIRRHLDDVYTETDKRQRATKELLVSFALYLDGSKLSLNLNSQRGYLRTKYESIPHNRSEGVNLKRRFVSSISDVAEFRNCYWGPEAVGRLNSIHQNPVEADTLKLCLSFIWGMNTSMSIPILARYWTKYREDGDEGSFVSAVRALTAFIVLRRSVTGNTGGIDSELRRLMQRAPSVGGDALCTGIKHSNTLLCVTDFQAELMHYLARRRIHDRTTWRELARKTGVARYSRPLCRFLLFSAAHHSMPDSETPGLLTRKNVRVGEESNFLNFRTWTNEKFATVEHVAPVSDPGTAWDSAIYSQISTRDTIGNLVLLPQRENSAIGNAGWPKKRVFYSALVAKTIVEKDKLVQRARDEGFTFSRKTETLLDEGERIHMLESVVAVGRWSRDFIDKRTENTLELAWDQLAPWLGMDAG